MAIKRNTYQGNIALGSRVKTTVVASLDSVVEGAELIADVIITARSVVELVHGSLQPAIAEGSRRRHWQRRSRPRRHPHQPGTECLRAAAVGAQRGLSAAGGEPVTPARQAGY